MHPSAMNNGKVFFERYMPYLPSGEKPKVVDIGAQNVNGSLREVCPENVEYIGVDFIEGKGIDVVLDDPYVLPFADNSVDVVVSSSCFEHSEMFWVLFLEVIRVLKPHGVFYLNAPSNGSFHRYPVDCWRFYPDCGRALVTWAKRNNYSIALLESFTAFQIRDVWNDYVAVFLKNEAFALNYPEKAFTGRDDVENITVYQQDKILKETADTEDFRELNKLRKTVNTVKNVLK
ncbi:MAG: methyltransferase domain-containing protein [Marinomonas sp.]